MVRLSPRDGVGRGVFGWLPALVLAVAITLVLPSAPAQAGRLVVTGHDADLHCSGGSQCHFVRVAVSYVRAGAPDPTKPVLVLDRGSLQFGTALDSAFGAGVVPRVVMDPRSAQFRSAPLTTSRYSAILVASDTTCGGCDLNDFDSSPDSDAINARKAAISSFFNAGGGVYANSGGSRGDGDPVIPDVYYSFVPAPLGGQVVQPPFCLTSVGIAAGFEDQTCPDASRRSGTNSDINCCATHNSFQDPPAGSALRVAERDLGLDGVVSADDGAETLIADGRISGGGVVEGGLAAPVLGRSVNVSVVRGKVFVAVKGESPPGAGSVPGLKGKSFVPLTDGRHIPTGSFLDTRRGTVKLVSATGSGSKTQSGQFKAGVFQVKQSAKRSAKGLTELRLKGGKFSSCTRASAGVARAVAAKVSKRTIRRLRAKAKGRFRTRGRRSAATVRGTSWWTEDRCDGTLTKVQSGKVAVRDFGRRKTIVVRRGQRYLARAGG